MNEDQIKEFKEYLGMQKGTLEHERLKSQYNSASGSCSDPVYHYEREARLLKDKIQRNTFGDSGGVWEPLRLDVPNTHMEISDTLNDMKRLVGYKQKLAKARKPNPISKTTLSLINRVIHTGVTS